EEFPILVAHRRRAHAHPDGPVILADETLLDRIKPDLAGHLLPVEIAVNIAIIRVGTTKQPPAKQLLTRTTDDRADRLVHPQEAALGVDLDDADGGVLVGGIPALLLLAQLALAAAERLVHAVTFGDVLEAVDDADERSAWPANRIDIELHHDPLAAR